MWWFFRHVSRKRCQKRYPWRKPARSITSW
jgi:hypothetical protein